MPKHRRLHPVLSICAFPLKHVETASGLQITLHNFQEAVVLDNLHRVTCARGVSKHADLQARTLHALAAWLHYHLGLTWQKEQLHLLSILDARACVRGFVMLIKLVRQRFLCWCVLHLCAAVLFCSR